MYDLQAYPYITGQCYQNRYNINGGSVNIIVDAPTGHDPDERQAQLKRWLDWYMNVDVLGAHGEAVIDLKNEAWLEDGEMPIDKTDSLKKLLFYSRLSLASIRILADGSTDWEYRTSKVFWGHGLSVHLEADMSLGYLAVE